MEPIDKITNEQKDKALVPKCFVRVQLYLDAKGSRNGLFDHLNNR